MFGIGTGEIFLILVITMLVVGPERMVELASQIGRMIAKFRQETDAVTQEFREAFSLESGEEENAEGQTVVSGEVSSTQEETLPAGEDELKSLPAPEAMPAGAEAEEAAQSPDAEDMVPAFIDGERETDSFASEDETCGDEDAAEDMEPVLIERAKLVPKDEEVEPTVIEGPVLMLGGDGGDMKTTGVDESAGTTDDVTEFPGDEQPVQVAGEDIVPTEVELEMVDTGDVESVGVEQPAQVTTEPIDAAESEQPIQATEEGVAPTGVEPPEMIDDEDAEPAMVEQAAQVTKDAVDDLPESEG